MEKILILGGTNFIGRNLVHDLLKLNKYDITLFNRGQTHPDLFLDLKKIKGDRNTTYLNQIFQDQWDYIIDLSCYFPDSLNRILKKINYPLKRYLFISTCSVYDTEQNKTILRSEESPTLPCKEDELTDDSAATYGKRKAECERILIQSDLTYTIFRPALVYGEHDHTDRFYYWLYQIKQNNSLLLPNKGDSLFSVTYVNDLVRMISKSIDKHGNSHIYNASTYTDLTLSKLVDVASQYLNKDPERIHLNPDFLHENKIKEWSDLPLWLDCDYYTFSNKKILADLQLNPTDFGETVLKTIEYYNTLNWKKPIYGMNKKTKDYLIQKLRDL